MKTLAPGARIVVRDAEWLIKLTTRMSNDLLVVDVVGVSDFIKGRTAQFIQELEDDLKVLDPESTTLVADKSSGYRDSVLFIEAHLRQTAPTGLTLFGRHQAPVIGLNELNTGEVVFVMLGVIPNRRGQPLINKWVSVIFQNGKFERIEDFEKTLERTSLGKQDISNRMQSIDENLFNLRGIAVEKAEKKMIKERNDFEHRINVELQEQYDRLRKLKSQHRQQLELRYADGTPVVNQRKSRE